jgi:hypothetical protein
MAANPLSEWGHRLAGPEFDDVALELFDAAIANPDERFKANVVPPADMLFAAPLTDRSELQVTTLEIHPDTLHPYPVWYRVSAAKRAGQLLLGTRIRYPYAAVPHHPYAGSIMMDVCDGYGQDENAHLKLFIPRCEELTRIGFVPTFQRITAPGEAYAEALGQLERPSLPADTAALVQRMHAATPRMATGAGVPRSRKAE